MNSNSAHSRLVYSTDSGRTCPNCRQALAQCVCKRPQAPAGGDGTARVWRESKGRGGKTVTLVKGLLLDANELQALGKRLRSPCGSGGTVKDGVIEIQGDHADRVTALLLDAGVKAKRAGG